MPFIVPMMSGRGRGRSSSPASPPGEPAYFFVGSSLIGDDGDPIDAWSNDGSALGQAEQADPGLQPTIATLDGVRTARCADGTVNWLRQATDVHSGRFFIAAVCVLTSAAGGINTIVGTGPGAFQTTSLQSESSANKWTAPVDGGTAAEAGAGTRALDVAQVVTYDSDTKILRVNEDSGGSAGDTYIAFQDITMGANRNGSFRWAGHIVSVLVYLDAAPPSHAEVLAWARARFPSLNI